jgi:hypothetical protein
MKYKHHAAEKVFILVGLLLVLAAARSRYAAEAQQSSTHAGAHQHNAKGACHGFVVLPNGFAVLSGMPTISESGSAHAHHGDTSAGGAMAHQGHDKMQHQGNGHAEHGGQMATTKSHLIGYQHGQAITLQEGMLCVPIDGHSATEWMAVSREPSLFVMAESLTGPLTHNSRENEALAFTIMRRGESSTHEPLRVRLLARMPHHDRQMPGGHGLANDPDVQGLVAHPDNQGRYAVQTVDFSMAGAWLFEIQVQQGADTFTAYFATDVGEE